MHFPYKIINENIVDSRQYCVHLRINIISVSNREAKHLIEF